MVSKSQADKAGERLRKGFMSGAPVAELVPSYITMCDWRAQHAEALTKTAVGLRSAVQTACGYPPHGKVNSRLKREGQILEKLIRERTRLSSMTDIAGCRAVLDCRDDIYAVSAQIQSAARKLEIVRVRDYVRDEEHSTGYQAIHILGVRDAYRVEIQLRTVRQHDWASRVERYDRMTGEDSKHGVADPKALSILRRLSETFATLDSLDPHSLPQEGS
jgi:ppGpp synthetase/RelA/SpoT-type nucleotidyltranferase